MTGPWLLDWCGSAFRNDVVRLAVGVGTSMAVAFVSVEALDGNWLATAELTALWAALVFVAVLTFRAGRTDGIREGAPRDR